MDRRYFILNFHLFFLIRSCYLHCQICLLVNWHVTICLGSKGWRLYEDSAEVRVCAVGLLWQCKIVKAFFYDYDYYFISRFIFVYL